MELEPGQRFTIWRKLEDPLDSATYYIQATIYDMRDNSVIQTANLTDQTGRIFSKAIDAPNDSSGQGRYVAISTRVYTDSGYTTLSAIHREESREYKIVRRLMSLGGGGSSVDYKKIEKMLRDMLDKLPQPKEISLAPLEKLVQAVGEKVDSKEIPEIDIASVLGAIRGLPDMVISMIKFPVPEKVDLNPVMNKLADLSIIISAWDGLAKSVPKASSEIEQFISELKNFIKEFADGMESNLKKGIDDLGNKAEGISNLSFTVQPSLPGKAEQPEEDTGLKRARNLL